MSDFAIPNQQREFRCKHCNGKIMIPRDLPPTTGPCPHCRLEITSPAPFFGAPEGGAMPVQPLAAVMPAAVPVQAPPVMPASPAPAPAPVPAARVEERVKEAPPLRQRVEAAEAGRGQKKSAMLLPVMLVALVLVSAAGAGVYYMTKVRGGETAGPMAVADPKAVAEAQFIRSGWQDEARAVLRGYIAAQTAEEKLPYIIDGGKLAEQLEVFYGGSMIDDSDTPAESFSVYELSEEDRKRGIFMLEYNRPPQYDLREFFRPVAPAEVQYGLEEPDLLLAQFSRVGNFTMDPVRVQAFFKRTENGLKLDWEIFAQTKYRTFANFTELPDAGATGVFRVFIVEDVPESGRDVPGYRTYRLADAANTTDTARVMVKVDSEIGKLLHVINWRGIDGAQPTARTATIGLKWGGDEEAPHELEIERFLCWEFLGLGGEGGVTEAGGR